MKIALVTMRTDPARGGAERYTVDLAAALANEGHEVSVLASSFVGMPAGVKQVVLDASGLTRIKRYAHFLDALDSHLAATPYDIVHAMLPVRRCDVYHPHAGLARANVASDPALKRLLNPRRAHVAAIEESLLESADPPVVLCLSQYVKRAVKQWYSLDETHLPILFNAVDLQKYDASARPGARESTRARYRIGDDECVALFIGQDFERKGLHEAVLATARIRSSENDTTQRLKLLVVGKARATKYLALARRHGAGDRVINAGHTDDSYAAYKAADFLVLPTKHDPCSLVVLEALATGVPVVSTRFNGACEIMTSGVHGFVLEDPANVDALAAAMGRMLDPALRQRMSQASVELRPKLAYENHLRTLLGIYQRVIERSA